MRRTKAAFEWHLSFTLARSSFPNLRPCHSWKSIDLWTTSHSGRTLQKTTWGSLASTTNWKRNEQVASALQEMADEASHSSNVFPGASGQESSEHKLRTCRSRTPRDSSNPLHSELEDEHVRHVDNFGAADPKAGSGVATVLACHKTFAWQGAPEQSCF